MYSGDKVFYGLKLSKNKIFKLLLNYICTNELQNTIYNHELFKKTYTIYKDLDEITKIFINNINLDDYDQNQDHNQNQDNNQENDQNQDQDLDQNQDQDLDQNQENDEDDKNYNIIDSDDNYDIDEKYYNEENKILLSIYELIKDEGDDNDLHNMILLLLKILSFKYLTLLFPTFWEEDNEDNENNTTFLGIELGYNDITHHYMIYKYKNFNNYYNNYMNNIRIMKNKMKRNKELYDNEFNKLIDIKPRIYSMANEC
jgi:hypothetical protein